MRNQKSFNDFQIGSKIEMTVIDPIEGKLDIGFVSQVEGHLDEDSIMIAAPIHEAKVYPVKVGSKIDAYLYFKPNLVYKITGIVKERLVINDIALLSVKRTSEIEKIQRRDYYRFECSVPVTFYMEASPEEGADIGEIEGQTIDISGGGILAKTDAPLLKDTQIKGWLALAEIIVDFEGKVLRCNREVINGEIKYISSISFIDIGHKQREKIVAFIFNQQRILLEKGLRGNQ